MRNQGKACATSPGAVNQSTPVALAVSSIASGPDGQPATAVTVTYQTMPLIPIPLLITRQLTVSRSAEFKE